MVQFLRPAKVTMIVFLLMVLFQPVVYIRTEPDWTNYLPGEERSFTTFTEVLQSTIIEFVLHIDGTPDTFLGIIVRNYLHNLAGIPLLLIHYLLASGLTWLIQRFRIINRSKGKIYA